MIKSSPFNSPNWLLLEQLLRAIEETKDKRVGIKNTRTH